MRTITEYLAAYNPPKYLTHSIFKRMSGSVMHDRMCKLSCWQEWVRQSIRNELETLHFVWKYLGHLQVQKINTFLLSILVKDESPLLWTRQQGL